MTPLSKDNYINCLKKRKESLAQNNLKDYITYSAILMPETLNISIKEAAAFFNYSIQKLYRLRSEFIHNKQKKEWGGRRSSKLSNKEECLIIDIFKKQANQGLAPNIKEMKARIESLYNKSLHISSIYRLLKRHECKGMFLKN